MLRKAQELGARWFGGKPADERQFPIPDVALDHQTVPPAVLRHLLAIRDAMERGDALEVGNRQRRLIKAGHEAPLNLTQCNELLRKYDAA